MYPPQDDFDINISLLYIPLAASCQQGLRPGNPLSAIFSIFTKSSIKGDMHLLDHFFPVCYNIAQGGKHGKQENNFGN